VSQLAEEWDDFSHQDRLTRVAASLAALTWMNYDYLPGSRASDGNGHFEPVTLPIRWEGQAFASTTMARSTRKT
jgi:hypothetical protein